MTIYLIYVVLFYIFSLYQLKKVLFRNDEVKKKDLKTLEEDLSYLAQYESPRTTVKITIAIDLIMKFLFLYSCIKILSIENKFNLITICIFTLYSAFTIVASLVMGHKLLSKPKDGLTDAILNRNNKSNEKVIIGVIAQTFLLAIIFFI
jgi:hypothetical protein